MIEMTQPRRSIRSIKFEKLTFKFDGHDPVLNQADFEFPLNQILWVKSNEGAGKSTLLQILAGLENPKSGTYWINEDRVNEMSFEEFLPYRLNMGYSFDYGGLINNRSLFDNLTLPLLYHKLMSEEEAKSWVQQTLARFHVSDLAHERPAHVPGRLRKLTCVLRALVTKPQVLFLDDPSVGLGEETLREFKRYLFELRDSGFCQHVFISSYDERFMSDLQPEMIHLDQGSLYHQESSFGAEKKWVGT